VCRFCRDCRNENAAGKQCLKSLGSVADSQGRPAARIEVLELKRKSAGKVREGNTERLIGSVFQKKEEENGEKTPNRSMQMPARAEQSDHADDDEIQRDDVVQESRQDQDQHAGDQCDQWSDTKMNVHDALPSLQKANDNCSRGDRVAVR
jgi:hypothetical protein